MTEDEIHLVRDSFAHLHRRKEETSALFYRHLFEIAPDTRLLFKRDLGAQRRKLMEFFAVAMALLHDPKGMTTLLQKLGRLHRGYGVQERHFASLGETLIWTLRTSLGAGFTPELERIWRQLYAEMARVVSASLAADPPRDEPKR